MLILQEHGDHLVITFDPAMGAIAIPFSLIPQWSKLKEQFPTQIIHMKVDEKVLTGGNIDVTVNEEIQGLAGLEQNIVKLVVAPSKVFPIPPGMGNISPTIIQPILTDVQRYTTAIPMDMPIDVFVPVPNQSLGGLALTLENYGQTTGGRAKADSQFQLGKMHKIITRYSSMQGVRAMRPIPDMTGAKFYARDTYLARYNKLATDVHTAAGLTGLSFNIAGLLLLIWNILKVLVGIWSTTSGLAGIKGSIDQMMGAKNEAKEKAEDCVMGGCGDGEPNDATGPATDQFMDMGEWENYVIDPITGEKKKGTDAQAGDKLSDGTIIQGPTGAKWQKIVIPIAGVLAGGFIITQMWQQGKKKKT